jgi:hypothetical protein
MANRKWSTFANIGQHANNEPFGDYPIEEEEE